MRERAPMQAVRYYAFVDPSGGSADSMTLAVGHREDDIVVVDALRERRPPFSPEDVVSEFAELLKSYRVSKITGDRYAGEWPRERFREHGISYEPAQKPKSDFYRDMLPAINSRKLDLLDDARLLTQLVSLERRTARGGRDSIDHAPGAHDDLANAVAGLAATAKRGSFDSNMMLAFVPSNVQPGAPPPPKFGTLVLEANTTGVEVFVDGKSVGVVNKGTPLSLPGLVPGSHIIKGVKMGYEPDGPREEVVYPGQETTVSIKILIVKHRSKAALDLRFEVVVGGDIGGMVGAEC